MPDERTTMEEMDNFSSVLEVSQVLLVSVTSLIHYGFEDIKDVMAILISYRNHQVFFPTPLFKKITPFLS